MLVSFPRLTTGTNNPEGTVQLSWHRTAGGPVRTAASTRTNFGDFQWLNLTVLENSDGERSAESNHPQFTGINSNIVFKSITGGNTLSNIANLADPVKNQNGFGSVSGARDPRILQTAVRVVF